MLSAWRLVATAICCLGPFFSYPQEGLSTTDKILNFPASFFSKVNNKTRLLERQLTRQTEKYLQRLARKEKKLKLKLSKFDSTAAQQLFANSEQQYRQLNDKIKSKALPNSTVLRGEYLPGMDSLKTTLAFLQQNNQLLPNAKEIQQKVQGSLTNVSQLQSKLRQSEQVKVFITQRKQQIREALGKYTKLPKGITNSFTSFSKDAFYYQQQMREYNDMLKDPDKMMKKGLTLLNKLPAFKQFMAQHGELASLFRLPGNYGAPQSLAGLQTRAQVQQQIQVQMASAGPNAQQYLQQNMQAAQAQLNQLKDKINKLGGGSSDMDMPDFKPNHQKTRSFWKRLEYGTNIQSTKSSYFYPASTDFGLSVGYKINDRSTIGVGGSYKMSWGKDIRHIAITHNGVGLRSFLDIKLKGSFFASGGLEYNYTTPFREIQQLYNIESWQRSGLLGVSKVVSLKNKVFKKTKVQLFWDVMSYAQVPRTQPIKFRVGYTSR